MCARAHELIVQRPDISFACGGIIRGRYSLFGKYRQPSGLGIILYQGIGDYDTCISQEHPRRSEVGKAYPEDAGS